MMGSVKKFLARFPEQKTRLDADEREKIARLEQAERELGSLQHRAWLAINTLDERQRRNHWRESIERMIQGAS